MKEKILVTGGTGYIGSHTVVELIQAGYEVVIIDNLSNSVVDVLCGIEKITGVRPIFVNLDCLDYVGLDDLFDKHEDISAIIHFAASKAVNESVLKPVQYYRNNVNGLINLLDLMPVHGVKAFLFSSSCTVYGQPDVLPVTEDAPIKPATSPYGNTKQIGEEIIRDLFSSGAGFKSIILRYFNPIGAHPSSEIGELPLGIPTNLVPYVTQTAIGLRDELLVYGNDYDTPDGTCIRDFINVVDLAKAHVIALKRMLKEERNDSLEYFNIGTGNGYSVLDIINTFSKVSGEKLKYRFVDRRAGDIATIWADPTKANKELGWKSELSLEDTLRSAWRWEQKLNEKRKV